MAAFPDRPATVFSTVLLYSSCTLTNVLKARQRASTSVYQGPDRSVGSPIPTGSSECGLSTARLGLIVLQTDG